MSGAPRSDLIVTTSITCPDCGARALESMPLNACIHIYECRSCHVLLRPRPGDCCVFCSYGSVRCPPQQMGVSELSWFPMSVERK
jgi:hypothetical protein